MHLAGVAGNKRNFDGENIFHLPIGRPRKKLRLLRKESCEDGRWMGELDYV
jgi:hypothetical protein